jgi:hypothetical protein
MMMITQVKRFSCSFEALHQGSFLINLQSASAIKFTLDHAVITTPSTMLSTAIFKPIISGEADS